jgi:hypothetical protein
MKPKSSLVVVADANQSEAMERVMEPETIKNNGASSKSHMSRENFFIKTCFLFFVILSVSVLLNACGGDSKLSGTWVGSSDCRFPFSDDMYEFSGRSYKFSGKTEDGTKVNDKGTYSITGDKIEFISDRTGVSVATLQSRTKNTFVMFGCRYVKK